MNLRVFISISISVLLGIYLFSCSSNETSLAIVNGKSITLNSFLIRYQSFLSKTYQKDNLSNRYVFLNTLIDEKLILEYAEINNIHNKPNIIEEKEKIYNQLLLNEYHKINITNQIKTSEKELRKLFTYYKTKLHVRHLFAKDLKTISDIEQKLYSGDSWEILAEKYFSDPKLKYNGGDLGWHKMGQLDPAFEIVAFSLDDQEISEPIKTRKGYSIIQVLEKEKDLLITEKEFQNNRKWLKKMAISYKKIPKMRKFTDKIVKNLDIRFDQKGVLELQNILKNPLKETIPQNDMPVLAIRNQEWLNVNQCIPLLNSLSDRKSARLVKPKILKEILIGMIVKNKMIKNAKDMALDKLKPFENNITEEYTQLIVNDVLTNIDQDLETINWQNAYFQFRNRIAEKSKISIDSLEVKSFPFVIQASI